MWVTTRHAGRHRSTETHQHARAASCLAVALVVGGLALGVPAASGATAASPGPGFVDVAYQVPGGPTDATSLHTQSKLWFHDGYWWSIMFRPDSGGSTGRWLVHRLDGQDWTSTGVEVDTRANAHMDTLEDGNDVYVVSSDAGASAPVRVFRLTYAGGSLKYTVATSTDTVAVGVRFATFTKQGNRIWIAYTQSDAVWTMSSSNGGTSFSVPQPLDLSSGQKPQAGTPGATSGQDDVAVVTQLGTGVGVLWNADHDGFYFATNAANTNGQWGSRSDVETAWAGTLVSDNHISVRTTSDGRVLAAVKSSLNDATPSRSADPLMAVLERTSSGTWRNPGNTGHRNVSNVGQAMTRPTLVIDEAHQQAQVLFSNVGGGKVYRRAAPLDTLDFGNPSKGEVFIASSDHPAINDATSTRDPIDGQTGLLVLASDQVTSPWTYLHGCLGGSGCPRAAQVAQFTTTATSGSVPLTVRFSSTSTGGPTSLRWDFGDGSPTTTGSAPSHTYVAPGSYVVVLSATYEAGTATAKQTVVVTPAATTTVLQQSSARSAPGDPVTLSATVTTEPGPPAPTGTVTFLDNGAALGTPVSLSGATASLATTALALGDHSLTAAFTPGTALLAGSTSSPVGHAVARPDVAPPVASFSTTPASGTAPLTVTLTDTSSPAATSWQWNFGDGSPPATTASARHVYTEPGTYTVTLTATNDGGSSRVAHTVRVLAPSVGAGAHPRATTVALTVSPSPSYGRGRVQLEATVRNGSRLPSGRVRFFDGPDRRGRSMPLVDGVATRTMRNLGVGTHVLTARYSPATRAFTGARSPAVTHVVEPPGATLRPLDRARRVLKTTTLRKGRTLDIDLAAPPRATAVAVTLVGVGRARTATLSACPAGSRRSLCREHPVLDTIPRRASPAFTVVELGPGGIMLHAGGAAARVRLDVVGWFVTGANGPVLVPVEATASVPVATAARWRLPAALRAQHPLAVRLRVAGTVAGRRSVVALCHAGLDEQRCRRRPVLVAYRGLAATNEVIVPLGRGGRLQLAGRVGPMTVRIEVLGLYVAP